MPKVSFQHGVAKFMYNILFAVVRLSTARPNWMMDRCVVGKSP